MNSFVESLPEVFERLGRIRTRRMFGGWGVYHEDRMFALVASETLYLKVDAGNVADFDRLGLRAFEYTKDGRTMAMSYREAPVEIFEDRQEAALWGRRAYEAALRSGTPPKRSR